MSNETNGHEARRRQADYEKLLSDKREREAGQQSELIAAIQGENWQAVAELVMGEVFTPTENDAGEWRLLTWLTGRSYTGGETIKRLAAEWDGFMIDDLVQEG